MIKLGAGEFYFARNSEVEGDSVWIDDIDIGAVADHIAPEKLTEALQSVVSVGEGLVQSAAAGVAKFQKVTLEFGVNVAVGGKLVVVQGDMKAHLKVVIEW